MTAETERVARALTFIPAEDREVWVRMAMACKNGLGDAGWPIWDAWSQTASNYDARAAASTWRSVKAAGGVTVASLFAEAKRYGWANDTDVAPLRPSRRRAPRPQRQDARRRRRAAETAVTMMARAELDTHPYLERKGFADELVPVLDENLLIPMRPIENYRTVASIQRITPAGEKRFLFGGRSSGCVYHIGSGSPPWYCEGFATGLSISAALRMMYNPSCVTVCFSAANVLKAARRGPRGYVVGEADKSGTSEKYASQTGMPLWIPGFQGGAYGDANDFHLDNGLEALAQELMEFRRSAS